MNIKIFSLLNKKKKFELKLIFFLSSIYFFLEFASLSSIPVFVGILINPELILTKLENLTNLEIIETYSKSNYQIFFAALVIFLFIIKNLYLVLITIYESSFLQRFKISISNRFPTFRPNLHFFQKNLAGWLAACLAGCLVAWLAGCLPGCLPAWLPGLPVFFV